MGVEFSCVSSREPTQHSGWEHQTGMKAADMARRPSKHVANYEEHYDRPAVAMSGGPADTQHYRDSGGSDLSDGAYYG